MSGVSLVSYFHRHSHRASRHGEVLHYLVILVQQVQHFHCQGCVYVTDTQIAADGYTVVAVTVQPVFAKVLSQHIALARKEERVGEVHPRSLDAGLSRSGYTGSIGDLLLVGFPPGSVISSAR